MTKHMTKHISTEKEMSEAAQAWIGHIINSCAGHRNTRKKFYKETPVGIKSLSTDIQQRLCNCVTEELNETMLIVPKRKGDEIRKTFIKMVDIFDNMKNKGEITGCTKKLNPID
jgi:predicted transcriptional regulator